MTFASHALFCHHSFRYQAWRFLLDVFGFTFCDMFLLIVIWKESISICRLCSADIPPYEAGIVELLALWDSPKKFLTGDTWGLWISHGRGYTWVGVTWVKSRRFGSSHEHLPNQDRPCLHLVAHIHFVRSQMNVSLISSSFTRFFLAARRLVLAIRAFT